MMSNRLETDCSVDHQVHVADNAWRAFGSQYNMPSKYMVFENASLNCCWFCVVIEMTPVMWQRVIGATTHVSLFAHQAEVTTARTTVTTTLTAMTPRMSHVLMLWSCCCCCRRRSA